MVKLYFKSCNGKAKRGLGISMVSLLLITYKKAFAFLNFRRLGYFAWLASITWLETFEIWFIFALDIYLYEMELSYLLVGLLAIRYSDSSSEGLPVASLNRVSRVQVIWTWILSSFLHLGFPPTSQNKQNQFVKGNKNKSQKICGVGTSTVA